jgi:hypothetical protein
MFHRPPVAVAHAALQDSPLALAVARVLPVAGGRVKGPFVATSAPCKAAAAAAVGVLSRAEVDKVALEVIVAEAAVDGAGLDA